jgi:phage baseplate assembly protein W
MLNRPLYPVNPQSIGQPRGIGISVLFNNGNNIFNTTTTTKEQVKSNLINYILTNKGERFYDPTFGGDLRASLFEQDISFDSVAARLETEILAYVPKIVIRNISVETDSDSNLVNIIINYTIFNEDDNLVINVSTNNLSNQ